MGTPQLWCGDVHGLAPRGSYIQTLYRTPPKSVSHGLHPICYRHRGPGSHHRVYVLEGDVPLFGGGWGHARDVCRAAAAAVEEEANGSSADAGAGEAVLTRGWEGGDGSRGGGGDEGHGTI